MDPKQLVALLAQGALFLVVMSFGLQARWSDVVGAMRNKSLIFRGVLAVNVVVPFAAVVTCMLFRLQPAIQTGIIVMAVSPLAPLAPGKMRKGGADTSMVIGMYVALIMLAIILVPLTVALLSALFPVDASISVVAVAKLCGKTILLPLAIGVAVASEAPRLARIAARVSGILGFIGIIVLLCLIAYVQRGAAAALIGDGTLLAITVILCAAIGGGYWLGRPDPALSNALSMAAAIRHPGIAALIIQSNFVDPKTMLTVVLFLVTSVIVTTVYQLLAKFSSIAGRQRTVC